MSTPKSKPQQFSPEIRERAVRMVYEVRHASQWAAIESFPGKFGCTPQTLSNRIRKAVAPAAPIAPAAGAGVKEL